jgi:hypothetical protein
VIYGIWLLTVLPVVSLARAGILNKPVRAAARRVLMKDSRPWILFSIEPDFHLLS